MIKAAIEFGVIRMLPLSGGLNPWVDHFRSGLEHDGWKVKSLNLKKVPINRAPEFVVIHWPEGIASRTGYFHNAMRIAATTFLLTIWRLLGTKVVGVGHNLSPHRPRPLSAAYLNYYRQICDGYIHLSSAGKIAIEQSHERLSSRPSVTVSFGEVYSIRDVKVDNRHQARQLLGLSSDAPLIFTYQSRSEDDLLNRVLAAMPQPGQSAPWLIVLGATETLDSPYQSSIRFVQGPIAESELMMFLFAVDLVILDLPQILHSTRIANALAMGTPVLARNVGAIAELGDEYPRSELILFEGDLDAATVSEALDHSLAAHRPDKKSGTYSGMTWKEIGAEVGHLLRHLRAIPTSGGGWGDGRE